MQQRQAPVGPPHPAVVCRVLSERRSHSPVVEGFPEPPPAGSPGEREAARDTSDNGDEMLSASAKTAADRMRASWCCVSWVCAGSEGAAECHACVQGTRALLHEEKERRARRCAHGIRRAIYHAES